MPGQSATSGRSHELGRVRGGPGDGPVAFRPRRVRLRPNLTKALTLGAGASWGSPPPVQVDFPAIPAAVGTAPDATAVTSTKDFIAAFKKPLTMPVLLSPP
jgi:hypothetical protein